MEEEIKNLGQMFTKSQSQMRSYIQDMFDTFQRNISNMIPTPSSGRHADPPHAQQAETTFSREKTTTEPNPGAPPNEHANITTAGTGGSHAESAKVTSSTSSDSNPPTPNVIPQPSSCLDNAQSNLAFPKPTFSLGLTQEERYLSKTDLVDADESLEEGASISLNDDQEPFPANRKSKRQKVVPRSLVGDYQCDKRFLTRAWEAHVNAYTSWVLVIDYRG
uniref:Uncharacterized protein n=1 Tax=Brassica campestris TaxID=3711 RepID=A0A3P6CTX4_BRACM|nr:unnamed protein product [Brassica rapa]